MRTRFTAQLVISLFASLAAGEPVYQAEALVQTDSAVEMTKDALPVSGRGKIRIAFSGRTSSRHTIEANERIRILNPRYAPSRLRLEFYDDAGKALAGAAVEVLVISQSFHEYVRVFHPPLTARALRIFLRPAKDGDIAVQALSVSTDLGGGGGGEHQSSSDV